MKKSCRSKGLTLIELLMTILLSSLLALVAIPSFKDTLLKSRVESVQRKIKTDLAFARSEAATKGKHVSICASIDGANCDNAGAWRQGWIVFVDDGDGGGTRSDGLKNGSEEIIRSSQPQPNTEINVADADYSSVASFGFNQRGYLSVVSKKLTLKICEPDGDLRFARGVLVDLTGRGVNSYDLNANGIREDINGNELSC